MVRAALCRLRKLLVDFFSLLPIGAHNVEVVSPPYPATALPYTVPCRVSSADAIPASPSAPAEARQTTVLPGGTKWRNQPGTNLLQDAIPRLQVHWVTIVTMATFGTQAKRQEAFPSPFRPLLPHADPDPFS